MKKILTLSLLALCGGMVAAGVGTASNSKAPVETKAAVTMPEYDEKDISISVDTDISLSQITNNKAARVGLNFFTHDADWTGGYVAFADGNYEAFGAAFNPWNYVLVDGVKATPWTTTGFHATIAGGQITMGMNIPNIQNRATMTITLLAGITLPSRAYYTSINAGGNAKADVYHLDRDYEITFVHNPDYVAGDENVAGKKVMIPSKVNTTMKGTKVPFQMTHVGYSTAVGYVDNWTAVAAASNRYAWRFYIPEAAADYAQYSTLGFQASDGDSNTLANLDQCKNRMVKYNLWKNHILIDGNPITIWNNDTKRIWLKDNYVYMNFQVDVTQSHTLTILKGTEFPSATYIAQGGTPKSYVLDETVSYTIKAGGGFEKYCTKTPDMSNVQKTSTDATNLFFTKEGSVTAYSYMNIVLQNYDSGDFGRASGSNPVATGTDGYADVVNYSNLFDGEHVLVDGVAIPKDPSGVRSARYADSAGQKGIRLTVGFNPNSLPNVVTVKKGTLIPSAAVGKSKNFSDYTTGNYYEVKRDVTFTLNSTSGLYERSFDAETVEKHTTKVTKITLSENAAGKSFRMNFELSDFDYTGAAKAYDGYFSTVNNVYTKVKANDVSVATLYGNATNGYRGHRLENSNKTFTLQLTGTFGEVDYDTIFVPAGTEFPSISFYEGTADKEQVYYTEADQLFVKTADNTYEDILPVRASAISEIEEYIEDLEVYNDEQKARIASIISTASGNIETSISMEDVGTLLANAKKDMDNIPTKQEFENIEEFLDLLFAIPSKYEVDDSAYDPFDYAFTRKITMENVVWLDEEFITPAEEAYDALTDDEKAFVDAVFEEEMEFSSHTEKDEALEMLNAYCYRRDAMLFDYEMMHSLLGRDYAHGTLDMPDYVLSEMYDMPANDLAAGIEEILEEYNKLAPEAQAQVKTLYLLTLAQAVLGDKAMFESMNKMVAKAINELPEAEDATTEDIEDINDVLDMIDVIVWNNHNVSLKDAVGEELFEKYEDLCDVIELLEYKAAAMKQVAAYKHIPGSTFINAAGHATIVNTAVANIEAAEDKAGVDTVVAAAKSAIDALDTNEEAIASNIDELIDAITLTMPGEVTSEAFFTAYKYVVNVVVYYNSQSAVTRALVTPANYTKLGQAYNALNSALSSAINSALNALNTFEYSEAYLSKINALEGLLSMYEGYFSLPSAAAAKLQLAETKYIYANKIATLVNTYGYMFDATELADVNAKATQAITEIGTATSASAVAGYYGVFMQYFNTRTPFTYRFSSAVVHAYLEMSGFVDLNDEATIATFEDTFESMTNEQKTRLSYLEGYISSLRSEFEARKVEQLIDAIGRVDLTKGGAIQAAKAAYSLLSIEAQNVVKADGYKAKLDNAQAMFDAMTAELANAKASAKAAIDDAVSALDMDKYSEENQAAITSAQTEGKAAIDAATSVNAVNEKATEVLNAIAAVKEIRPAIEPVTDQIIGCEGSIIAASGLISLVTLLGAGLICAKRKED